MKCYNTQIMTFSQAEPKRSQTKKFQRQVWLQIYFPIAFVIFILGVLAATLSLNQKGTASVWGDASLIMLFIPVFVIGLILLLLLIAFAYLVARLVGYLPTPMSGIHQRMKDLDYSTRRLSRTISRPFFFPSAVSSAIRAAFRGWASIFERRY